MTETKRTNTRRRAVHRDPTSTEVDAHTGIVDRLDSVALATSRLFEEGGDLGYGKRLRRSVSASESQPLNATD